VKHLHVKQQDIIFLDQNCSMILFNDMTVYKTLNEQRKKLEKQHVDTTLR